jgi:hypothetical protein
MYAKLRVNISDLLSDSLQAYFASVARDTRLARLSYLLEWDLPKIVSQSHDRLAVTVRLTYGQYHPGHFLCFISHTVIPR